MRYPLWYRPSWSNVILELTQRNGGRRCDEVDSEGVDGGLGMNDGMSREGTDLVEPLSNMMNSEAKW